MIKYLYYSTIISLLLIVFACNEQNPKTEINSNLTPLERINFQISTDSSNSNLFYERSKIFAGRNQFENAMKDITKAIDLDSNNSEYYLTLADYFLATNQSRYVKDALIKVISIDPNNINAYLQLAELYLYVQNFEQSMIYTQKAIELDNNNPNAYLIKAINYKEKGDTNLAINNYLKCTEVDPSYYKAYIELGYIYYKKRDNIAIKYFENALKVKPNSTEALFNIGKCYQDIKIYDLAINNYKKAINIDSTHKDANFNIGYIKLFYVNNFELTTENIEEFKILINSTDSIKQHIIDASKHFSICTDYYPDFLNAYFLKGLCFELLGQNEKAIRNYQQVTLMEPKNFKAQSGLKRLHHN